MFLTLSIIRIYAVVIATASTKL